MTGHDRVRSMLSAYRDGELFGAEKSEVEAHLLACDECCVITGDYESLDALISEAEREPPEYLMNRIMSTIRMTQQESKKAVKRKANKRPAGGRRFYYGSFTAVAAVAALVVIYASGAFENWFSFGGSKQGQDQATVKNADMVERIEDKAVFTVPSSIAPDTAVEDDAGALVAPEAMPRIATFSEAEVNGDEMAGGGVYQTEAPSSGASEAGIVISETQEAESGTTEVLPESGGVYFIDENTDDDQLTFTAVIASVNYNGAVTLNVKLAQSGEETGPELPITVSNSIAEEASDILYVGNTVKITVVAEGDEIYVALSITD